MIRRLEIGVRQIKRGVLKCGSARSRARYSCLLLRLGGGSGRVGKAPTELREKPPLHAHRAVELRWRAHPHSAFALTKNCRVLRARGLQQTKQKMHADWKALEHGAVLYVY